MRILSAYVVSAASAAAVEPKEKTRSLFFGLFGQPLSGSGFDEECPTIQRFTKGNREDAKDRVDESLKKITYRKGDAKNYARNVEKVEYPTDGTDFVKTYVNWSKKPTEMKPNEEREVVVTCMEGYTATQNPQWVEKFKDATTKLYEPENEESKAQGVVSCFRSDKENCKPGSEDPFCNATLIPQILCVKKVEEKGACKTDVECPTGLTCRALNADGEKMCLEPDSNNEIDIDGPAEEPESAPLVSGGKEEGPPEESVSDATDDAKKEDPPIVEEEDDATDEAKKEDPPIVEEEDDATDEAKKDDPAGPPIVEEEGDDESLEPNALVSNEGDKDEKELETVTEEEDDATTAAASNEDDDDDATTAAASNEDDDDDATAKTEPLPDDAITDPFTGEELLEMEPTTTIEKGPSEDERACVEKKSCVAKGYNCEVNGEDNNCEMDLDCRPVVVAGKQEMQCQEKERACEKDESNPCKKEGHMDCTADPNDCEAPLECLEKEVDGETRFSCQAPEDPEDPKVDALVSEGNDDELEPVDAATDAPEVDALVSEGNDDATAKHLIPALVEGCNGDLHDFCSSAQVCPVDDNACHRNCIAACTLMKTFADLNKDASCDAAAADDGPLTSEKLVQGEDDDEEEDQAALNGEEDEKEDEELNNTEEQAEATTAAAVDGEEKPADTAALNNNKEEANAETEANDDDDAEAKDDDNDDTEANDDDGEADNATTEKPTSSVASHQTLAVVEAESSEMEHDLDEDDLANTEVPAESDSPSNDHESTDSPSLRGADVTGTDCSNGNTDAACAAFNKNVDGTPIGGSSTGRRMLSVDRVY